MTFFGECRADEQTRHHLHESPPSMTVPLMVLAALSVAGGWIGLPLHFLWGDRFGELLAPVFGGYALPHLDVSTELLLMATSVAVALVGFGIAYWMYMVSPQVPERAARRAPGLYRLVFNKYYVDEIYDLAFVRGTLSLSRALWKWIDIGVIDAAVNGTAETVGINARVWRRLQTGNVQHYAVSMLIGATLLLGYYALK
jgi:NADH-quinone oxidoreductase subunit L